MDIAEVRERKTNLEKAITQLLIEFDAATGMHVESVYLRREHEHLSGPGGMSMTVYYYVEVELRL